MASSTPLSSQLSPSLLQLPLHSPQFRLILAGISLSRSKFEFSRKLSLPQRSWDPLLRPVSAKEVGIKCFPEPSEEVDSGTELVLDKDGGDGAKDDVTDVEVNGQDFSNGSAVSQRIPASGDSLSLGIREPVYEVVEVRSNGMVSTRKINRRYLLKSSGLRPRDIRSVDPSLWLTNSMPSLLVDNGGKAFIDTLLPRLNPKNMNGGPTMPFVLEVVEAALHSRIQRLEQRLMNLEPRVQALLEVLPNRLTADILEELRISKQRLVELGSRAGALKQMLLDILEDTHEIRQICIMGRNCTLMKNNEVVCSVPLEKEIAEEEEEEIEMLLENYLQRCESCHGQAERLLDSAKEMEDSIAVNLRLRHFVLQLVPLLQATSNIIENSTGIFGMNLRSYLEEHIFAFWLTTAGIFFGAVVGFFLMYSYLRKRKIL
ncbi:magnesium transporter mrs2-11 chloroplastic [Phtheirospermum japonicum]|uniref:Magnesium transporter mrs2-11 chloroplastic n=1 Tax=Phtheirospermum japonicum TaxID=374723 RepID=A0A830CFN3_9LAMI|nr:magnesium transporter mrs2-11 chloroplastic [Phtheirospermum japonicum]